MARHGKGRALAAFAGVLVLFLFGNGAGATADPRPPSPARLVTITIPAAHGAIPAQWIGYPGPPRADVLLPAGYNPSRRYPLLVLLGGLGSNYDSYNADGIVARIEAAKLNAVVVMPEGANGWYADWWNGGPAWETYELEDVLPTVLARYRILPQRQYHAIAGFSMGGLGAVYLAGRLPGFFGSVASLSGFDDPQYFAPITQTGMGLISNLLAGTGEQYPDPVYGPPNGFYADGHNPVRLAVNLHATRVFQSTGTGVPSASGLAAMSGRNLGAAGSIIGGSVAEAPIIYPMNQRYHDALTVADVDVTYQVHAGGHDLPDFDDEWQAAMAWGFFRPVPAETGSWTNDTVATRGQLWDVGYRFARPPTALVQFHQSGRVLSISAAGSPVTITTAGGCAVTTATPATIKVPSGNCK